MCTDFTSHELKFISPNSNSEDAEENPHISTSSAENNHITNSANVTSYTFNVQKVSLKVTNLREIRGS